MTLDRKTLLTFLRKRNCIVLSNDARKRGNLANRPGIGKLNPIGQIWPATCELRMSFTFLHDYILNGYILLSGPLRKSLQTRVKETKHQKDKCQSI